MISRFALIFSWRFCGTNQSKFSLNVRYTSLVAPLEEEKTQNVVSSTLIFEASKIGEPFPEGFPEPSAFPHPATGRHSANRLHQQYCLRLKFWRVFGAELTLV